MSALSCSIMKRTIFMRKARCVVCSSLFFFWFHYLCLYGFKVSKSRGVKKGYVVIRISTKPQASSNMTRRLC